MSLQSQTATSATCSGEPIRRAGVNAANGLDMSSPPNRRAIGVSMMPGLALLIRMPCGPLERDRTHHRIGRALACRIDRRAAKRPFRQPGRRIHNGAAAMRDHCLPLIRYR
ncbi:hypothetical protein C7S16_1746 [Burkholderia thailandensis]|uniref:Uncharacterized protein n=1 Tax=Burkholderia thailandensis TaxID=57975 RepID=A0AAW9D2Y5_BURTH|nr:hypothetical protein [Burkholderia thailandensis]MDW9256093.1 hypothetical protein [Burkholderia thailandensis]